MDYLNVSNRVSFHYYYKQVIKHHIYLSKANPSDRVIPRKLINKIDKQVLLQVFFFLQIIITLLITEEIDLRIKVYVIAYVILF